MKFYIKSAIIVKIDTVIHFRIKNSKGIKMEQEKFVFISHKNDVSPDAEICIRLYEYFTRKRNICCWMDRKDMRHSSWEDQVNKKIFAASAYILIASENSLTSPRVQEEIELMTKLKKPLIPFSLDSFYLATDVRKGAVNLQLGVGRLQSVFLPDYINKDKTEEEAFEDLISLLPKDISKLKNNPEDFQRDENDEGVLKKYTGHDTFVEIPAYVREIAADAFQNKTEIVSVYIPDSVEEIGKRAFFGCGALSRVEGMAGVRKCGASAFDNTAVIFNEANNYSLNGIAIGGKTDCEELNLKQGIKVIADKAFYRSNMKSLTIPDGTEVVGRSAFAGCMKLTEAVIPKTVRMIEKNAFQDCLKLDKVIFKGELPEGFEQAFDKKILDKIKGE